jgi:hypothetical protein
MSDSTGTKRTRTEQPDNTRIHAQSTGQDALLIAYPAPQTRLGQKYCDEAGLLALLLAYGIVRRVRTIEVTVQPLGGDNFTIKLDAAAPSVGKAKAEIARTQGTAEARQELYKVAVRVDGGAVREEDANPEALDDDAIELGPGEIVAMAVKEPHLAMVWQTWDEDVVSVWEGGAVATNICEADYVVGFMTLVTSDVELTVGKHYWEVEILDDSEGPVFVGVARPNLEPNDDYAHPDSTDGWFIRTYGGTPAARLESSVNVGRNIYGNEGGDGAGTIDVGDRVGLLLDLNEGSLRFFVNDMQRGPGYPAGSVTGPVVCAVQLCAYNTSVQLLRQDGDHALLQ